MPYFSKKNMLHCTAMTRHTYFISDLHLCESHPEITAALLDFVEKKAKQADALYILGDLFEAWVGDDHDTPLNRTISQALATLADFNTAVYIMHGNRDFLIGQRFVNAAKAQLIPDPSLISIYGKNLLLAHGDALCTDDSNHQRFRRLTQRAWLRRCFLMLPLSWRHALAQRIRQQSAQRSYSQQDLSRYDVTEDGVRAAVEEYPCDCLIHGHTHRPKLHHHTLVSGTLQRHVLGAWEQTAEILRLTEDGTLQFETLTVVHPS